MGMIQLLWCVFAVIVIVLAWITLRLNRAVSKEMRARAAITAQLAALHDIDMVTRLQNHPEAPAAQAS
ncbi:MAG: hypothetical protein V4718_07340, partial [Pseudomonadota bacterium]